MLLNYLSYESFAKVTQFKQKHRDNQDIKVVVVITKFK